MLEGTARKTDLHPPSSSGNTGMFIHGYEVFFPKDRKPFPAQIAVMSKVLQAAKESKNALLESPTGTGKVKSSSYLTCTFIHIHLFTLHHLPHILDHILHIDPCVVI